MFLNKYTVVVIEAQKDGPLVLTKGPEKASWTNRPTPGDRKDCSVTRQHPRYRHPAGVGLWV